MKAKQEEILSQFLIMVKDIMANGKVGEKKAKGQVYDFIIQQFPDTRRNDLYRHVNP